MAKTSDCSELLEGLCFGSRVSTVLSIQIERSSHAQTSVAISPGRPTAHNFMQKKKKHMRKPKSMTGNVGAIGCAHMTANALPFAGSNYDTNVTMKEADGVIAKCAEMLRNLEAAIEAVGGF